MIALLASMCSSNWFMYVYLFTVKYIFHLCENIDIMYFFDFCFFQ